MSQHNNRRLAAILTCTRTKAGLFASTVASWVFHSGIPAICCYVLGLIFTGLASSASAQSIYLEQLKQAPVYASMPSSVQSYFGSVQAAFAAHQAELAQCTNGYECTADNLQPCPPGSQLYQWGQPLEWCWHEVRKRHGQVEFDGITGNISQVWGCPADYVGVSNHVSGSGSSTDPRHYENYCERGRPRIVCDECGVGNPIFPSAGTKRQNELDYADAQGTLTFRREYNSAFGRFRHEYEVDFIPPGTRVGVACLAGVHERYGSTAKYPACFHRMDPGGGGLNTNRDGSREEFAWNGTEAVSATDYFKNRVVAYTANGEPGWLMTRPRENQQLVFDAIGRLLSVHRATGSRVNLGYNVEGQLVTISDEYGRTLHISQDGQRVVGLIEACGQVDHVRVRRYQQAQSCGLSRRHVEVVPVGRGWTDDGARK